VVDLCIEQSTSLSMVDLRVLSTLFGRRTGRGLMGVQLPVLTSQPGINLLRSG